MIQPGVKIPTGETYLRTGTTLARLRSGYGSLVNLASGRSGHRYQNYPYCGSAIRRYLMVPLEEALQIRSSHPSLRTEGPSAKPLSTRSYVTVSCTYFFLLCTPCVASSPPSNPIIIATIAPLCGKWPVASSSGLSRSLLHQPRRGRNHSTQWLAGQCKLRWL